MKLKDIIYPSPYIEPDNPFKIFTPNEDRIIQAFKENVDKKLDLKIGEECYFFSNNGYPSVEQIRNSTKGIFSGTAIAMSRPEHQGPVADQRAYYCYLDHNLHRWSRCVKVKDVEKL